MCYNNCHIYTAIEKNLHAFWENAQKWRHFERETDKMLTPNQMAKCAKRRLKQTTKTAAKYQTMMESMKNSKWSSTPLFDFIYLLFQTQQDQIHRFLQGHS